MLTYIITNTVNNHSITTTELHKAIYFVRDELGITYPELAIVRDDILDQSVDTVSSYKSLDISIKNLPVESFVKAHPGLHDVKHIAVNGKKYKRLSMSGKILDYWERDENGKWHDRTKQAQLQEQIDTLRKQVTRQKQ